MSSAQTDSTAGVPKPKASPLPPIRRVVTGHTPEGRAVVLRDNVQPPTYWSADSVNTIYDLGRVNEIPARNDSELVPGGGGEWVDEIATQEGKGLVSPRGASVRAFEFEPGTVVPFHRTQSLDYGILTHGEVILELDKDESGTRQFVKIKAGDVILQRGTMHAWYNQSRDTWARMIFVVIGACPIQLNGSFMAADWPGPADTSSSEGSK